MPSIRLAGVALAGLLSLVLVACGGNDPQSPPQATGTPATGATSVSVAKPVDEAPRVELETTEATTSYPVSGTTTEEIFASIEVNGPTDNVGQQGSGLTSVDWEYKWTGVDAPDGSCRIRELTVSADIVVELPQHVDEASLPQSLLANWQAYAQGVADHEQRHVDIYLEGARDIQAAMREIGAQTDCDQLDAIIDGVWNDEQARIDGLQDTFHSEENARLTASRGPLEDQIDANRAQLNTLQADIVYLDGEMSRLRAELTVLDNEVASVDAQIKQINDQFPDDLPDAIRDRLEDLVEQSNELLAGYNQRVEEHNAAFDARSDLSAAYETLLAETNALVDQYNWTR